MDLREKKTKRSIKNAFIKLRSQKPLERISVKELAELAEISKATFYLHYHDIYDLSDHLQKEVIQNILDSLGQPDIFFADEAQFTRGLFKAFLAQQSLIDILFSGSQAAVLPISIEEELRKYISKQFPEYLSHAESDITLTYKIQGGFYAYQQHHKKHDITLIIDTINQFSQP